MQKRLLHKSSLLGLSAQMLHFRFGEIQMLFIYRKDTLLGVFSLEDSKISVCSETNYYLFFASFLRWMDESVRLRRRIFCGVISTSSSSSMYSSASSSVNTTGGVS